MTNEETKLNSSRFTPVYRTLFVAAGFTAFLIIFELLAVPGSDRDLDVWGKHINNGSYFRLLFVLGLSAIAMGLFVAFAYVAAASSPVYKIVYFLIFALVILTEYGYANALGRFFEFHEVEVAIYATNWDIISNAAVSYFNYLAFIPILLFGLLLIFVPRHFEKGLLPFLLVVSSIGLFFVLTSYLSKNTFYVNAFNYGLRTSISVPVDWYIGSRYRTPRSVFYYTPRDQIEFKAGTRPKKNIVFVMDESIRGDHLSINGYEKPTTPFLVKLENEGFVRNWGTASSGTTCSTTSNALVLTGLSQLPDKEFKVYKLPTILQYAKAMNYKTTYFDGQVSWLWNGKPSDRTDYGRWITEKDLSSSVKNKFEYDAEIAKRVRKITSESTGNFIWINKFGVHKPYSRSYPGQESSLPLDTERLEYEKGIDDASLVRQYDNAISYNLESFFKELAVGNDFGKNTVILYTADHGQSLREEGATGSHCSETKAQAKVPLLLLGAPGDLPDVDTGFKASHANIFATLLDLMDFPEAQRKHDYPISLLEANASDSKKRHYYVGDLNDPGKGKRYPFDQ